MQPHRFRQSSARVRRAVRDAARSRPPVVDHGLSAQERPDDTAPERRADERAVRVAVQQLAGLEHALVARGRRSRGRRRRPASSRPFAGEPEAARPPHRSSATQRPRASAHGRRTAASSGASSRLAARDAAPDRERVVALLQLGRATASDPSATDRDVPGEQRAPERLDLGPRPERRRALGERADALARPRR